MVVISQYMHITNQHAVHLKQIFKSIKMEK